MSSEELIDCKIYSPNLGSVEVGEKSEQWDRKTKATVWLLKGYVPCICKSDPSQRTNSCRTRSRKAVVGADDKFTDKKLIVELK